MPEEREEIVLWNFSHFFSYLDAFIVEFIFVAALCCLDYRIVAVR